MPDPLRILHISTRLILGGSQENTVLSCEGQARLGHEVRLAFGPIYGPEGSMLERVRGFRTEDGRGIATHEVPHLVRELSPEADPKALRELVALIADLKPDIVHTHSSKAGILGRMAAWRVHRSLPPERRAGVVHTVHGPPFMPLEGSPVRRAKIRAKNKLYEVAEKHAARRCHVIVSVADAMTEQFLARGIGRLEQYATVRSGMDVEPYLTPRPGEDRASVRAALGLAETDLVFGTVARLAEHKGHDDVIDAFGEDLRARPDLKLLWVGDGWWKDRLVGRLRTLGARPDQIVLTGLVPPDRIPGLMRAMDVLIHPSYREGLPRTVPQALLCGVPVIATDADGTREACIDGETGRLIPVGDPAALRAAAGWMAEHPEERRAMGERGRALCREAFSAERMVADLEAVYRRALAAARA